MKDVCWLSLILQIFTSTVHADFPFKTFYGSQLKRSLLTYVHMFCELRPMSLILLGMIDPTGALSLTRQPVFPNFLLIYLLG